MTRGYDARHSDDFPYVAVKVEMADGETLSICTTSQQAFMLPWKDTAGEATFSKGIPDAILALLPRDATNRERLRGRIQDYQLDELLGEGLGEPVGRLRAEAEAGSALQALEARFKVTHPTPLPSFDGKGPYLAADLQLPDTPANLSLTTRLPLQNGALIARRNDIARIADALSLAQTAPALAARMKARPTVAFGMNDGFGWEWLNAKTADQFMAQMQAMGRLPELKTRPELMRGAVMVLEGKEPIYWIVLPDHRAVLWKRYTREAAGPGTMRCASVPMGDEDADAALLNDLCQGAVYDASGRLQP